ncbi:uncharacterized protein LOC130547040 isoform X1 [Triplophysa rosa]|uniref:uncharacterized protein LOC130547040 isoform X1 n=1 Tax=Triplophysa rosa TaxID=992332 RepID=UPI002545C5AC|nr:uncharacterized protein LOC130547040 isoform X1 [Triplophysa rosa]
MGNKTNKCFISTPESVKHIAESFCKKVHDVNALKLKKMADKDKCKFVFVYCPIVSRAGTDIEASLNKIKTEFPKQMVILIVLHHTFNPEIIVSDSSKFVDDKVSLTVDCLFHEDQGLLKCERNSKAVKVVAQFLKSQKRKKRKYNQKKHIASEG